MVISNSKQTVSHFQKVPPPVVTPQCRSPAAPSELGPEEAARRPDVRGHVLVRQAAQRLAARDDQGFPSGWWYTYPSETYESHLG